MTNENFRFARSCSGLLAKPSDLLFTALRSVDRCAKDSTRTQRTNNAASDHIIFTAAVEWCDYDAPVSGGEQLAYSLPKIGADKTEAGPPKDPKKTSSEANGVPERRGVRSVYFLDCRRGPAPATRAGAPCAPRRARAAA